MHRAREDLAATKVREHEELRQREDCKARQTCKAREERIARETPEARAAREARILSKARDARAKERKVRTRDAKERSTRRTATGREHGATNLATAPPANLSLPYLPISPCDTTPMPARHWYDVELEHSRSAMTGVFKSLIPTTNATLAQAYGRHYGRIAITRLRAFDTSRPPITANHAPVEPVPCFSDSHHSRAAPPRRPSPPTPRARAPSAVPPPPPCELATFRSRRHLRRVSAARTDELRESGPGANGAHATGQASPLLIAYRPLEPSSNHRPWLCLCL